MCPPDHHPAYITWEQFLENEVKVSENPSNHQRPDQRGAAREGVALPPRSSSASPSHARRSGRHTQPVSIRTATGRARARRVRSWATATRATRRSTPALAHDGLLLIGSTTADYPGVWAWDWGNPTAAPVEAVDPAHLPSDVEPVISALAVIGDHLIVGYRVACGGDPEGAGHASMLFDCDDTLGASAGPMSCVPILDDTDGTAPLDVRNIEVVPEAPLTGDGTLVLYVADGGRRWDGADTAAGEGTVYEVRISPSGGYTVADTDTRALFDAEPLAEVWALASVYDAAWEFPVAGETDVSLLAQGALTWRVFAGIDGVRNGWDTPWPGDPTSEVLDDLAVELAWDGAGESFQNSQGRDVTVVRGAPLGGLTGGYGDAVIGGGNGDWKLGILHGRAMSGTREPGDRPCPISMWRTAAAYSVAAWSDPTGATDPELWAGIVANDGNDADTAGDENRMRGVVHADDANNLDDPATWCWDTFARGISGLPNNYVKDLDVNDIYELLCQDSGDLGTVVPWNTCNQNTSGTSPDSFDMTYADIGNLYRLVAVDRDYAIGAAAPATLDDGAIGGEGLWVIHHDGTNGLTYTHVAFPSGVSCAEAAAFDETSGYQLTVDEEALVAAGGSGDVILYVTSHHNNTIGCGGAWQVTLNYLDAAPSAAWTEITPSSTTCPFAPYDIYGARPTRDGRFVYLWGGDGLNAVSGVCRVDLTGATATELAFPATPYLAVVDVLPHPHLDDVIFVGTNGGNQDDEPASGDGGLYLAQRRFRPGIHPPAGGEFWLWGSKKFGYYDLEERRIAALDWGTGWGAYPGPDPDDPGDDQLTNLYLAAYGGGWWDGALEVE